MTIEAKRRIMAGFVALCFLITSHHWFNAQTITFRGIAYTVVFVFSVVVYRWYALRILIKEG